MPSDGPRPQQRARVAIIGAGVSGLLLSYVLRREIPSIDVQIFEKEREFVRSTGSGMTLWPHAVDLLDKWGLRSAFEKIATRGENRDLALQIRRSPTSSSSTSRVLYNLPPPSTSGPTSYHRAHLLDLIAAKIPLSSIHFNTPLLSYTSNTDSVKLTFTNGSSAICDVLFACDGLYSTVRAVMYKEVPFNPGVVNGVAVEVTPKWTGGSMFKAAIPYSKLKALVPQHHALECMQIYLGPGNVHIQAYPTAFGQSIQFVVIFSDHSATSATKSSSSSPPRAFRSAPASLREITRTGLEQKFARWDLEVRQLIRLIPDSVFGATGITPLWPINALAPLSTYATPPSSPRIALLGDAAHATSPHLLLGASSALDDVHVLSTVLKHAGSKDNIPIALKVYDDLRRKAGREVVEESAEAGTLLEKIGNGVLNDGDAEAALEEMCEFLEDEEENGMSRRVKMEQVARRKLEEAMV